MTDVKQFKGKYRFLSNFWPAEVEGPMGLTFPTVEHAYQASKCARTDDVKRLQLAPTPGLAKRLGRRVEMIEGFDRTKLVIMEALLMRKFHPAGILCHELTAIDGKIEEGNTWHDTYWGVDLATGEGFNHLGLLLMKVRDVLIETGWFE